MESGKHAQADPVTSIRQVEPKAQSPPHAGACAVLHGRTSLTQVQAAAPA
jgi:hypothetical protein